jgi:hypothetical protein
MDDTMENKKGKKSRSFWGPGFRNNRPDIQIHSIGLARNIPIPVIWTDRPEFSETRQL